MCLCLPALCISLCVCLPSKLVVCVCVCVCVCVSAAMYLPAFLSNFVCLMFSQCLSLKFASDNHMHF